MEMDKSEKCWFNSQQYIRKISLTHFYGPKPIFKVIFTITTFDYNYQNSFRLRLVIETCHSPRDLKNNSPNLHNKTTNWKNSGSCCKLMSSCNCPIDKKFPWLFNNDIVKNLTTQSLWCSLVSKNSQIWLAKSSLDLRIHKAVYVAKKAWTKKLVFLSAMNYFINLFFSNVINM